MTQEPDWVAVGARIKKMCEQRGFKKRREFQAALGPGPDGIPTPLETISYWWGGRQPSSGNLARIAQALDVDSQWLLWGDEGQPKQESAPETMESLKARIAELEAKLAGGQRRVDRSFSGVEEIEPVRRRAKKRIAK